MVGSFCNFLCVSHFSRAMSDQSWYSKFFAFNEASSFLAMSYSVYCSQTHQLELVYFLSCSFSDLSQLRRFCQKLSLSFLIASVALRFRIFHFHYGVIALMSRVSESY